MIGTYTNCEKKTTLLWGLGPLVTVLKLKAQFFSAQPQNFPNVTPTSYVGVQENKNDLPIRSIIQAAVTKLTVKFLVPDKIKFASEYSQIYRSHRQRLSSAASVWTALQFCWIR